LRDDAEADVCRRRGNERTVGYHLDKAYPKLGVSSRTELNRARVADVVQEDLEAAVRAAWALDTCDLVDADDWSAANRSLAR
jgi:hypothetical protein